MISGPAPHACSTETLVAANGGSIKGTYPSRPPPFYTERCRYTVLCCGVQNGKRGPEVCRLSLLTISRFCKSALSTKESQTYVHPLVDPPVAMIHLSAGNYW